MEVVGVANAFKTQYLNRSARIHKARSAAGAFLYEAALCSAPGICKRQVDVDSATGRQRAAKVWFQSFSRVAAMTDDKLQLIYDASFRI